MSITTDIFWMLCAFASVALAAATARKGALRHLVIDCSPLENLRLGRTRFRNSCS